MRILGDCHTEAEYMDMNTRGTCGNNPEILTGKANELELGLNLRNRAMKIGLWINFGT
jgi:hypothetical protein